jgi:hypothetical protein
VKRPRANSRSAADRHPIGVAADQPHLIQLDPQPLHHELGEARLVALAGRERADHHVDPPVGPDRDVRPLARRAGGDLD